MTGQNASRDARGDERVCRECGERYSVEAFRDSGGHYFDPPWDYAQGCAEYCLTCWLGCGPDSGGGAREGDEQLDATRPHGGTLKKSRAVEQRADQEARERYGRSREEARREGACIRCGTRAVGRETFRDEGSWKEYEMSLLCQTCQDAIFSPEDPGRGGGRQAAIRPVQQGEPHMQIVVEQPTRIRIALYGPNRLFGDFKERKELHGTPEGRAELERRFTHAWNGGVEAAVRVAEGCLVAWVRERLKDDQRKYLDDAQEHRHFRHENMEFIVQLRGRQEGIREVTQLWKIPSGDDYPRVLWITFETVEEKTAFVNVAGSLGYRAEDLGLELLRDFLRKFERGTVRQPPSAEEEIPF